MTRSYPVGAQEGISLNKAALRLLRNGAGLAAATMRKANARREPDGVDRLAGSWTKEEAEEFDKVIEEMFEVIDEDMWR